MQTSKEKIAIILRGPAGVGKSSTAQELKKKLPDYVLLSIDAFRHMISKESSDMRREIARDVGHYFLEQIIEYDLNVIIEEIFHDEYLLVLKELLQKNNYKIVSIFLTAPESELQKRNASREKVISEESIRKFSILSKPNSEDFIIDATAYNQSDIVEKIISQIQK